jgi:hypothetical protein
VVTIVMVDVGAKRLFWMWALVLDVNSSSLVSCRLLFLFLIFLFFVFLFQYT